MATLTLGKNQYKDGEQIEYYEVSDYLDEYKGKYITLANIDTHRSVKKIGILKNKSWTWMPRWVIIDGKYQRDLNDFNVLNTKPFRTFVYNILILDSEKTRSLKAQTPIQDGAVTNSLTAGTRRRKRRKTRMKR